MFQPLLWPFSGRYIEEWIYGDVIKVCEPVSRCEINKIKCTAFYNCAVNKIGPMYKAQTYTSVA